MKAYIAAPIFTPEQLSVVDRLIELVKNAGFDEVFSPYHASRDIWKGRRPKDCSPEERLQVVRQNRENIVNSELVVCWLNGRYPDGRADTGVTWEMGYAYAIAELAHGSAPYQIGFLHRQFALMLTGTLDGLVDTYEKLLDAAGLIYDGDFESLRLDFSPDKFNMNEDEVTGGEEGPTVAVVDVTLTKESLAVDEQVQVSPDNRHALLGRPTVGDLKAHSGRSQHTSDPH
jgi:hypothetical protein